MKNNKETLENDESLQVDKYDMWFGNLNKISKESIDHILEMGLSPEEIYKMTSVELKEIFSEEETDRVIISRKFWDLSGEAETLLEKEISFSSILNANYPDVLRYYHNPPRGLYYSGNLPNPNKISIAVVGARKCSPYGKEIATLIGKYLARNDVQVISGLAMGIDGIAQRAAVDAGGETFGILGCGVDICYPQSNIGLFSDIQATGGLISEYPPGTKAQAYHFPERNRIISGLSDVVVVVEAQEKSGSLITADFALEQGKDVVAVPGKVTDKLSFGCNYLIYQGAEVYLGRDTLKNHIERLRREKGISEKIKDYPQNKQTLLLEKKETMVYSCLSLQPKRLEELLMECHLTFAEIQGVLLDLQLKGCVKEVMKNRFVKCEV